MKAVRLLLYMISFIGAVCGDENATIIGEGPVTDKSKEKALKIKDIDSNATVRLLHYNREETNDKSDEVYSNRTWNFNNSTTIDARRILNGKRVKPGARPYMTAQSVIEFIRQVYLNLTEKSLKAKKTKGWLCGGVIVHKEYVITSAACVEDGDKFYVISGTVEYKSAYSTKSHKNKCISKHQRRVVWKCVPTYYNFSYLDDVKWSANDIAVVKVDRPFNLGEVEEGCQFAAEVVPYNNISRELEEPGTKGYILGWGSIKNFREHVYRRNYDDGDETSKERKRKRKEQESIYTKPPYTCLQEAKVVLMDKDKCAAQWPAKFRDIIREYMICTKDIEEDEMSPICNEKYANCTVVGARRELSKSKTVNSNQTVDHNLTEVVAHPSRPAITSRRRSGGTGGFCEYDHGGPLVIRHRGRDHVVGVISVCRIEAHKTLCHGPFLYTSVFKNRQFLSCAIHKDVDEDCRRVFRAGLTHKEWTVDWDDE